MRQLYFQCPDAHWVSKAQAIQIQHIHLNARKLADPHEWLKFREVLFSAVSGMGSSANSHCCHVAFGNNVFKRLSMQLSGILWISQKRRHIHTS
jgi:hypothetical protein